MKTENERYDFARKLARLAGARALRYWHDRARLVVELKGPQDFVTHADRDVESLIRSEIASAFRNDAFLGEETAAAFTGRLDRCWVVDPIDGTHNFLRGVPYWNVAIAYVEQGRAQCAAIYDPAHDELFHAVRGGGAWCDRAGGTEAMHVASTASLAGSYVALGHHDRSPDASYLEVRRRMMEAGMAVRNFGSAALQLAHVAQGRLDAFVELQLSVWDAIGAIALVEEAGGYAAPFEPAPPTAKLPCLGCAPGIADALARLTEIR